MDASPPRQKPRSPRSDLRLILILAVVAVSVVGCSTVPVSLRLAPELAGVISQPVAGRNVNAVRDALNFGRWNATATMHRSDDHSGALPGVRLMDEAVSLDAERTGFEFDLRSNGALPSVTQAQCLAQGRSGTHTTHHGRTTDETSITLPGYPRLDCEFSGALSGQLTVRPTYVTQRDLGSAQFAGHLWEIRSVNNLESQRTEFPLARFGYEFRTGGRVVAAVETWGAGRVWMDPKLSPQDEEQLSVAITALLYYGSLLELDDT